MSTEKGPVKEVIQRKLADLIPYDKNPSDNGSVPEIEKSIAEHGFYNPIIIDQKDRIVCGDSRYKAAQNLSLETVPCTVLELNDAEYMSIMLSDNRIAALSKHRMKTLKVCLDIMDNAEKPPVGFSPEYIDKIYGHKKGETENVTEANFGEAGVVKVETDQENANVIKRKIFQLTPGQHEDITAKFKAYIKENKCENEAHALIMIMKDFKRAPKTIVKAGPVRDVKEDE